MSPLRSAPQAIDRVLRPKEAARTAYDRLSRWYDFLASSEAQFSDQMLEMIAIQASEKVLEIGYGTGRLFAQLSHQTGQGGLTAGIDLSWGMAQVAKRKCSEQATDNPAGLSLGDGSALPFGRNSFDVAIMVFTLELFDTPEIPLVLAECRRVLRNGGRLGIAAMSISAKPGPMVKGYAWFHRNFPAIADCRPIPLLDCLISANFHTRTSIRKDFWGLPVELVVADNHK